MATLDKLDAKAFEVLEAVYESGGAANTSEIKQFTGIEKNAIIHYRYDRLEEAGLIETRTGETEGGRVPPKVAELTEKGRERIADGLFDDEDSTIVERMERLERQFRAVVEEYREMERELREFRYDEESDEEISARDLLDQLEQVRAMGEEIEEIYDDAAEVEELHERLSKVQDSHESYRRTVDEMDTELHELQEQVGAGSGPDVEALRADVQEAEQEADAARSEADALEEEVDTLRSEQAELRDRLADLEQQEQEQQDSGSTGLLSSLR